MNEAVVVTRPNHDVTTRYLSTWAEAILAIGREKGYRVIDLKANRARAAEVESVVEKTKPALIWFNGHGSANQVAGQDNEVLVQTDDKAAFLEGTMVYALACQSAKELGPQAVEQGARAYLGYDEDFIFVTTTTQQGHPQQDTTARLFLEPSNHVPLALLKGNTAATAQDRAKGAFRKNIRALLTSITDPETSSVLRYLVWDMQHLVVCGDPAAAIPQ